MALCREAHPLSFGVPLHLCRADHGVHSGWDLGADSGCSLLVQVSQALLVPASPSLSLCLGELVPMLPGCLGGGWRRGNSCPCQSPCRYGICPLGLEDSSGTPLCQAQAAGSGWHLVWPFLRPWVLASQACQSLVPRPGGMEMAVPGGATHRWCHCREQGCGWED